MIRTVGFFPTPALVHRSLTLATAGFLLVLVAPARAQTDINIAAWGGNSAGQCDIPPPPPGVHYSAVEGGAGHTLALRTDGRLAAWGLDDFDQCKVPSSTYNAIAAGGFHNLALRHDNVLVAWGSNSDGQCDIPAPPPGMFYTDFDAGSHHSIALRSDGEVIAWGYNGGGQCNVPKLPSFLNYLEVGAGRYYSIARVSDGSLLTWGGIAAPPTLPPNVTYTAILDAGYAHVVALRSDGQTVAWGNNTEGQCDIPTPPQGVTYISAGAGLFHTTLCRSDGVVVATGKNNYGQCNVPALAPGRIYVGAGAGWYHSLALTGPDPCGGWSSYDCKVSGNSVSTTGAKFTVQGCASHATNALQFSVADLPHGKPGIFFYGPEQTEIPFGNGYACVAGNVFRVLPPAFADSSGTVSYPIDLTRMPFASGAGQILPGSTWNFQFWYRDPDGNPKTYNLSNAMEIVFAP